MKLKKDQNQIPSSVHGGGLKLFKSLVVIWLVSHWTLSSLTIWSRFGLPRVVLPDRVFFKLKVFHIMRIQWFVFEFLTRLTLLQPTIQLWNVFHSHFTGYNLFQSCIVGCNSVKDASSLLRTSRSARLSRSNLVFFCKSGKNYGISYYLV